MSHPTSHTAHAINDEALDRIFRAARTHNKWTDEPVSDALLMALYDLLRWGPTAANSLPARFLFLTSMDAKLRLKPLLNEGNREKTMQAPAVAIIGYDLDFPEQMPRLFPAAPKIKDVYAGKPDLIEKDALRSGSLQGAYLIIAARALGLDCGPMGGFNRAGASLRTACSHAARNGSEAGPCAAGTSTAKPILPPFTTRPAIMSCCTMLRPLTGSITWSRALKISSRLSVMAGLIIALGAYANCPVFATK